MSEEYPNFVYSDRDMYDVFRETTDEELGMMVELLCSKVSCDLEKNCRHVPAIVNEFQRMGGNSFANVWRGYGVTYSEIVRDVANCVGADVRGCCDIGQMEWSIVEHLIEQAEEKMSQEEREEFYQELRKQSGIHFKSIKDLFRDQAIYHAVRLIIIQVIVRQILVKVGIKSAATLVTGRLVTILAGPVGWVIGGIWTAIDIVGPAYSVTVPGVMLVAMIRARLDAEEAAAEIGGKANERVHR